MENTTECDERVVGMVRDYLAKYYPGRLSDAYDPNRRSHIFRINPRILRSGAGPTEPRAGETTLTITYEFSQDVPKDIFVEFLKSSELAATLERWSVRIVFDGGALSTVIDS